MENPICIRSPDIRTWFWDLRQEFTDATIRCGNDVTVIRVHVIILASSSPYFRNLLDYSKCLEFPDIPLKQMQVILKFMYKGEAKIDAQDYPDFLRIAKQFQLKIETDSELLPVEVDSDEPPSKRKKLTCDTQIWSLPIEILTKIFSMLSTYDLLANVARVSKRFHDLTTNPGVHIRVSLIVHHNNTNALKFLKSATLMKELFIEMPRPKHCFVEDTLEFEDEKRFDVSESFDVFLESLTEHENIRSFTIDGLLTPTSVTGTLLSKSKWWPKLTELSMFICTLDPDFDDEDDVILNETFDRFSDAVKMLESSRSLRHFDISSTSKYRCEYIMPLALRCNKLKSFIFSSYIEDEDLNSIFECNKDTLEELKLDQSLNKLNGSRLLECLNLKTLILDRVFDLFQCFPHLKNLKTLEISVLESLHINDLKQNLLPNSLLQMENLQLTSKHDSPTMPPNFDDHALLTTFAKACPNLKSVKFSSQNDGGIRSRTIRKLPQYCSKLEILKISTTKSLLSIDKEIVHISLMNLHVLEWRGKLDISNGTVKKLMINCPSLSYVKSNKKVFLKSSTSLESILPILERSFIKKFDDVIRIC